MNRFIALFLTFCAFATARLPCGAAEETSVPIKIELSREPSFKDGAPQTVRTKLTDLRLDGYRADFFLYDFGGKTVGVEARIGKPDGAAQTDSARLKVELVLRDGATKRAAFHPAFGAGNGSGRFEHHVAEFGAETKLSDIQRLVLTVDDRRIRFVISRPEKK